MKRAFLLAYPAGHSISPAMHNAAFAALGIEARYEALEVPPEKLAEAVARLRRADCCGANVTIPHKLSVAPLLDELTADAEAVGAVNTVVNENGRLLGHNTDAAGFLRALCEDGGFRPAGKDALLLGAGGAARAVAYALLKARVNRLYVYNRSEGKARAIAQDFAALGEARALEPDELGAKVRECQLLVNATSVGMRRGGLDPQESPLPKGVLPEGGFVCDIVYRPPRTRLLREAEAKGLKTQNGLTMLVYQGAEAFERWTGQPAPVGVMLEAAGAAL